MRDAGCVILGLLAVLSPVILYVFSRLREEKAANAEKRARAERIHRLLHKSEGRNEAARQELTTLLTQPRVGYLPELDSWFERAAPALRTLVLNGSNSSVVEWYFECFSFPAGRQAAVLSWLRQFLDEPGVNPERLQAIVERFLGSGGAAEAAWFYHRSLEALRDRAEPSFKTFVLYVGRLSYAFDRVGRRPTTYDEQAIANDIAMNVR